jgi:hypothetical protein
MSIDFKGRARMIFALLAGIVFLVLQAVFPELPFTESQTILFMGLIGAYVLGEGISGKTVGDNLASVFKSQKFQALIAGIIVSGFKAFFPSFPISDVELTAVVISFMAFIIGAGAQKPLEPQG